MIWVTIILSLPIARRRTWRDACRDGSASLWRPHKAPEQSSRRAGVEALSNSWSGNDKKTVLIACRGLESLFTMILGEAVGESCPGISSQGTLVMLKEPDVASHAHMRAAPVLRLGTKWTPLPIPLASRSLSRYNCWKCSEVRVVRISLGKFVALRYSLHHATMAHGGLSSSS